MLQRHSSATLAASARAILDEKSKVVNLWQSMPDGCYDGRKIITACLMKNGQNLIGEPSAVMFRKQDARRGFDPKYLQIVDMEMWFHLLEKGDLAYTREPLCAFRCHPLQQTERNTTSGRGDREHVFFYDYATQPWIPRKAVFALLFHLHRHLRRQRRRVDIAAVWPELLECERRLIDRGGKGWRWFCGLFYIRYRFTKPFGNFFQSARKRFFRWRWRPWPAAGPRVSGD
jgi:hypothetical protein